MERMMTHEEEADPNPLVLTAYQEGQVLVVGHNDTWTKYGGERFCFTASCITEAIAALFKEYACVTLIDDDYQVVGHGINLNI